MSPNRKIKVVRGNDKRDGMIHELILFNIFCEAGL